METDPYADTININTEMNYWPAETTNLAETHLPVLVGGGHGSRPGYRPPHIQLLGLRASSQHRHLGRCGPMVRSTPCGRWGGVDVAAFDGALALQRRQAVSLHVGAAILQESAAFTTATS